MNEKNKRQKNYVNHHRRALKFKAEDQVFLKVTVYVRVSVRVRTQSVGFVFSSLSSDRGCETTLFCFVPMWVKDLGSLAGG
nr:hypothetical protein [Tanacetum cinerariifolium]